MRQRIGRTPSAAISNSDGLFAWNGTGKTTLLLAAAGLVPFTGSISIDGIPVEKKSLREARDRLGFLFNIPEDQILFPKVLDDVEFSLIRKKIPPQVAREMALSALAALDVSHLAV